MDRQTNLDLNCQMRSGGGPFVWMSSGMSIIWVDHTTFDSAVTYGSKGTVALPFPVG